jgi:hypothetical protein
MLVVIKLMSVNEHKRTTTGIIEPLSERIDVLKRRKATPLFMVEIASRRH